STSTRTAGPPSRRARPSWMPTTRPSSARPSSRAGRWRAARRSARRGSAPTSTPVWTTWRCGSRSGVRGASCPGSVSTVARPSRQAGGEAEPSAYHRPRPLEQAPDDRLKHAIKDRDIRTADVVRMLKTKLMERRTAKGFAGTVDDALVLDVIGAYRKQLQKAL